MRKDLLGCSTSELFLGTMTIFIFFPASAWTWVISADVLLFYIWFTAFLFFILIAWDCLGFLLKLFSLYIFTFLGFVFVLLNYLLAVCIHFFINYYHYLLVF